MIPAAVTIRPTESRAATPTRCRKGICSFMMMGIGSSVTSKSATQLMIPAASVARPSSRHFASFDGGNSQYAWMGTHRKVAKNVNATHIDMLKAILLCMAHRNQCMAESWERR